jgi:thymidylate kinase
MAPAYLSNLLESARSGRRGGSVALLGIDGSGKSTHATELESWFRDRGYLCTRVPFHHYLIVDRLSRRRRMGSDSSLGTRRGGHPLRPLLSAVDNLMMHVIHSFGRGSEGRVIVYDRFSWSTYVKYKALGYRVGGLRWIFFLPSPKCAILLDVPVRKSLDVIASRISHIRYAESVLAKERDEYLSIARSKGLTVIDATGDPADVQELIESRLARVFPVVGAQRLFHGKGRS